MEVRPGCAGADCLHCSSGTGGVSAAADPGSMLGGNNTGSVPESSRDDVVDTGGDPGGHRAGDPILEGDPGVGEG